jgi:MoxR-like ATPase
MAERQITVDGITHTLSSPFFVIATQNSLESLGTFPLPEAQMDRFLMQLSMEKLDHGRERALVGRFLADEPLEAVQPVCGSSEIVALQRQCREVYIHPDLIDYIIDVVQATRDNPKIASGVSPRGTLAFVRASQGYALVKGQAFVTPEDIKAVAIPVLAHRMSMNVSFDAGAAARHAISDILCTITVPTEDWSKR